MKTIPNHFTTPGYLHGLVRRQGQFAIYSQAYKRTGRISAYEILRIRVAKSEGVTPFGTIVSPGDENLPGSSTWGQDGFTVRTLEQANSKLEQLLSENETRNLRRMRRTT